MNQILSVSTNNKKKKNKASIKSILIVFSVMLMLFGIGLTSSGAYSYYRNTANKGTDKNLKISSNTKPEITIEREDASNINIQIKHDKPVESASYKINDGNAINIETNGRNIVKQHVELENGTSKIEIDAKDINGVSASYENTYQVELKISIKLEEITGEGKIKATVESKENIDYIEYYWDNNTENSKKYEINDKKTVTQIDVLEGKHVLTIKSIDKNGYEVNKNVTLIGAYKPKIKIEKSKTKIRVTATDDNVGLSKIEITLNSNEKVVKDIEGEKYQEIFDMVDGENTIFVKVYNKDNVPETAQVQCTKE